MNISIDGGALCADENNRYGNYRYSFDLLTALSKFDTKNKYKIYTFCDNQLGSSPPNFSYKKLIPPTGFMPYRVGVEEFMFGGQVFLSLNQSIPTYTRGKVISVCHGLSYYFYPNLYPTSYMSLNHQLEDMIKRSDAIVVSSERVRQELRCVAPNYHNVSVIPFGVPDDMIDVEVLPKKEKYFLFVGMDHPIKRIDLIVSSFLSASKKSGQTDWKLVMVGVQKKYESIDKSIRVIPNATHSELIKLYQKASCLVTASIYESFNFPILEALSCGTHVIGMRSAVIPEFEEFVDVVDDEKNFTTHIENVMIGKLSQRKIFNKDNFSWKSYIKKLISLYS